MTDREKCIYCGTDKDITVDHVPPKLLLEQPYPENLITVPTCFPCNQSFQKDDEYLRIMLCIDVRASRNIAAQSNLPAVLRSLQRSNAKGFVEYLANQSSVSAILDQYGAPMGQVMELDNTRTKRTGQRFIRALYFAVVGTALPQHTPIRVGAKLGLRARDADTITIARALKALPDWRNGSVGTAFSYVGAIGPEFSFWFMLLYDFFFWLGTVDCRDGVSVCSETNV
jgi:hypothetical protein